MTVFPAIVGVLSAPGRGLRGFTRTGAFVQIGANDKGEKYKTDFGRAIKWFWSSREFTGIRSRCHGADVHVTNMFESDINLIDAQPIVVTVQCETGYDMLAGNRNNIRRYEMVRQAAMRYSEPPVPPKVHLDVEENGVPFVTDPSESHIVMLEAFNAAQTIKRLELRLQAVPEAAGN